MTLMEELKTGNSKCFNFGCNSKYIASLKDVVRALEENNYLQLAAKLNRKYLLAADSSEGQVMF